MKYTIEGFSQQQLVKLGLDVTDVIILRWIVDFYNTDKMKKYEINGTHYFWIYYQTIVEELPILNIGKRTLARRLDKMVDCGLLKKYIDKKAGNYTYFRLVEDVYLSLISKKTNENLKGMDKTVQGTFEKSKGYGQKSTKVCTKKSIGYGQKSTDIYSSTNNSSISTKKNGGLKSTGPSLKEKGLKEKDPVARELVQFFYKTLRPNLPASVVMWKKEVHNMKLLLKKLDKRKIKAYIEAIKSCKEFHCLNCNSPTYLYSNLQSIYEELEKRR